MDSLHGKCNFLKMMHFISEIKSFFSKMMVFKGLQLQCKKDKRLAIFAVGSEPEAKRLSACALVCGTGKAVSH